MTKAKKDKEIKALEKWFHYHPVEHPEQRKLVVSQVRDLVKLEKWYFDILNGYKGVILWPKAAENYYKNKYYTYLSDPRRKERIGKYLTWAINNSAAEEMARSLNRTFNDHTLSEDNETELCVVISRHEYDIVGQSTDRNWTSCQNIYDGGYNQYVERGISAGVLIAYLCDIKDTDIKTRQRGGWHVDSTRSSEDSYTRGKKINIQRPLGRVLIKPYVKKGESHNLENPNWILRVSKKYGMFPDELLIKLQKWLDKNWNNKILENEEDYSQFFVPDTVYQDTDEERAGYHYKKK